MLKINTNTLLVKIKCTISQNKEKIGNVCLLHRKIIYNIIFNNNVIKLLQNDHIALLTLYYTWNFFMYQNN